MGSTESRHSQIHLSLGVAVCVSGCLAVVLSMCGQLFAARRLATDINSGHPSADQGFVHMLAVTPSLCFSALAILLCVVNTAASGWPRGFAILGMVLGVIAAVLTFLDIPGSLAAEHWVEPYPGGLR
ncbi:hypothetical protein ACTXJ3_10440 [Brachybacterium paraconglomeratum]|uniref:hypothetical protein n=1 Tax=Brachybacterium paraconglomeratum TaxID=173362 RepID=UPI0030B27DF4